MILDEAIRHCEEVAEQNDKCAESYTFLARHLKSTYERLSAAKCRTDCAEGAEDYRQLAEWLRELKKAKWILKDALITLNDGSCNKDCRKCVHNSDGCDYSCRFKWKHTDEVIKLIGGDDECI